VNAEVQQRHTRILRLTLAVAESRAYWSSVEPAQAGSARVERAFNERWFGHKSLARVKLLLSNFAARFDAYPEALETLRRWVPEAPATRSLVCHWHLQLSDPLYRAFTGSWLVERRLSGRAQFDTDVVARALSTDGLTEVAASTRQQYASKLIRAADEAGLVSPSNQGPRTALAARVPDEALGYLVRLLRQLRFDGDWRDNAYFRSVGLDAESVDARLRRLPDVSYHRMGELIELEASPLEALR
jgi:hypothetical protein